MVLEFFNCAKEIFASLALIDRMVSIQMSSSFQNLISFGTI
jgi:hypothetical protein